MINDARLGFDTRGFAAWLLTRPRGWQIRASALPRLLRSRSRHVGRDRARRFLRELERAGYLTRTRHRTADGRWVWDNAFRPNPALSTIDAFSVDGKHVDLIPVVDRQAVLDEFAAMLRDSVVRHPMGLLNRLVERAKGGRVRSEQVTCRVAYQVGFQWKSDKGRRQWQRILKFSTSARFRDRGADPL